MKFSGTHLGPGPGDGRLIQGGVTGVDGDKRVPLGRFSPAMTANLAGLSIRGLPESHASWKVTQMALHEPRWVRPTPALTCGFGPVCSMSPAWGVMVSMTCLPVKASRAYAGSGLFLGPGGAGPDTNRNSPRSKAARASAITTRSSMPWAAWKPHNGERSWWFPTMLPSSSRPGEN